MSEPELLGEPSGDLEVGLPIVGLVEDVEVLLAQADAAEAVVTPAAARGEHEVGAPHATLAFDAMRAHEARGRALAVRAVDALGAARAVVTAGDAAALDAERAVAGSLAALAREATDVRGRARKVRAEL